MSDEEKQGKLFYKLVKLLKAVEEGMKENTWKVNLVFLFEDLNRYVPKIYTIELGFSDREYYSAWLYHCSAEDKVLQLRDFWKEWLLPKGMENLHDPDHNRELIDYSNYDVD